MELSDWPGTVCVPADVLEGYYYAVAKSYLTKGAAGKLVFFNFHSLNHNAANAACRRLQHEGHRVFLVDWWKTVGQNSADLVEDRPERPRPRGRNDYQRGDGGARGSGQNSSKRRMKRPAKRLSITPSI